MSRRIMLGLVSIAAVCAFAASPAGAGGSPFHFERDHYVPGEIARGITGFSLIGSGASLDAAPFYAYLLPSEQWIEPPVVPSGAIPLGRVTILDGGGPAEARIARIVFAVPPVKPGSYNVALCNSPCTDTFLGDLVGGWISVVGSAEERILMPVFQRLESQFRAELADAERRLESRVATSRAQNDTRYESLLEANAALTARIDAAQRELTDLRRRQDGQSITLAVGGWSLAGGVVVAMVLWLRHRSRRIRAVAATHVFGQEERQPPRLRDGSLHPDFEHPAARR
ncbi:hypothetical protein BH20ACT24_BH20ACT24_23230 [soil metagenome]